MIAVVIMTLAIRLWLTVSTKERSNRRLMKMLYDYFLLAFWINVIHLLSPPTWFLPYQKDIVICTFKTRFDHQILLNLVHMSYYSIPQTCSRIPIPFQWVCKDLFLPQVLSVYFFVDMPYTQPVENKKDMPCTLSLFLKRHLVQSPTSY